VTENGIGFGKSGLVALLKIGRGLGIVQSTTGMN
jgi:hypothetical protein